MPAEAVMGGTIAGSCAHGMTGTIVSSCARTFSENRLIARLGDHVICSGCGASGVIISGSPTILVENKPASRMGDACVGTMPCDLGFDCCSHAPFSARIVSGAPTVQIG